MYDELKVSKDFKVVEYDDYSYHIKRVMRIPTRSVHRRHRCTDGYLYTVDFRHIVDYEKKAYYVSFCNKCKTLFLRLAK